MGKKTAYIPDKLFQDVTQIVRKKGLWANEAEFIREAIRRRLNELAEENQQRDATR